MTQHVDVKRAVTSDKVTFRYYQAGELWYATEAGELFPVPVSEFENTRLDAEMKPMLLMRYMRRWNAEMNEDRNSDWGPEDFEKP